MDNYIIDKSGNSQIWGNGYDTTLDASDDDTIVLYNVNSWAQLYEPIFNHLAR